MNRHLGSLIRARAGFAALILHASVPAFASPAVSDEVIPGEFIVKARMGRVSDTALSRRLGARLVRRLPGTDVLVVRRPEGESVEASLQALAERPEVEAVEPNRIVRLEQYSREPRYDELWGLKNTGQKDGGGRVGIPGVDIGAEGAWDVTTGSSSVVVAVVDTGVDLDHPDLEGNLWVNRAEANGRRGVDDDGNGYVDDVQGYDFNGHRASPRDDNGHGTHVAGTIGARGDNGMGVTGVNWRVKVMPLKSFNANGGARLDAMIEGVNYAARMGARILNASWGIGSNSPQLEAAIEETARRDVLFVAAAGNRAQDNDRVPQYPASSRSRNVIAVAAADNQGALAPFSCYGRSSVHLAAPGASILSTMPSGYGVLSGTSMAAPHVAGAAALLLAAEPGLSALQLKDRLVRSAAPMDKLRDKVVAGGMLNASRALRRVGAEAR